MRNVATILFGLVLIGASAPVTFAGSPAEDLEAARALFERNLDAIRNRDRAAYLSCYLQSDNLARTGPDGLRLGYRNHAEQAESSDWPDLFEGLDLRLVPVRPGVVYGTYRYRVRYGSEESTGISERLFVETDDGWRIAMTSAFEAPPGTPPPPRALIGATLIDGTGAPALPNAVVLIRGGRIECVGTRAECPVPDGVERLNLSGFWITPGVIDAHVHFSQTGWADGRPDALDLRDRYPYEETVAGLQADPGRWFRAYLCSGVTAVFDVGGYTWTLDLPRRAEIDTMAPRVKAAGPLLSTVDHWPNLPAERQFVHLVDETAAREAVRYLAARGSAAINVWFIVREGADLGAMSAAVMAAGEEARARGIPLVVHATGLAEAKVALRAGAHMLVHSVRDRPIDDEFIRLARDSGAVYCPTLTVLRGYQRLFRAALTGEPPEIDDPHGCVDPVTRERVAETASLADRAPSAQELDRRSARMAEHEWIMAANLKRVHVAGIPVAMGTDAGNPLTLHGPSIYAEMEAMESAGMPALSVLVAATRGGAEAMGRPADLGTIEAGKLADLLVLGADPTTTIRNMRQVQFVMRGGELRAVPELAFPRR